MKSISHGYMVSFLAYTIMFFPNIALSQDTWHISLPSCGIDRPDLCKDSAQREHYEELHEARKQRRQRAAEAEQIRQQQLAAERKVFTDRFGNHRIQEASKLQTLRQAAGAPMAVHTANSETAPSEHRSRNCKASFFDASVGGIGSTQAEAIAKAQENLSKSCTAHPMKRVSVSPPTCRPDSSPGNISCKITVQCSYTPKCSGPNSQ